MINMKMIEIKNWNDNCEKFRDMFHIELKEVSEVMPISQWKELKTLIGLNIFKFEEKMREKWYKDGSLKEFVESKYWKEASVLIDKLL